jgi:hypothetical protein
MGGLGFLPLLAARHPCLAGSSLRKALRYVGDGQGRQRPRWPIVPCGSSLPTASDRRPGRRLQRMFSRPEERTDNGRHQRPDGELTGNEVPSARAGTPESV